LVEGLAKIYELRQYVDISVIETKTEVESSKTINYSFEINVTSTLKTGAVKTGKKEQLWIT